MVEKVGVEREQTVEAEQAAGAHEEHELPRGALLLTIVYLLILTLLWVQVYFTLLSRGGIPQQ